MLLEACVSGGGACLLTGQQRKGVGQALTVYSVTLHQRPLLMKAQLGADRGCYSDSSFHGATSLKAFSQGPLSYLASALAKLCVFNERTIDLSF